MTECRMQAKYGIDEIDFPQTDTWKKKITRPKCLQVVYTISKDTVF